MLTGQGADYYAPILASLQHSYGLWLLSKFRSRKISLFVKEIKLHVKPVKPKI